MNEDELRAALRGPSAELRFVAAHAVGDRRLPWPNELIERLTDGHPAVRQAARRSLLILSFLVVNPDEFRAAPGTPLGKFKPPVDFGPAPTAAKAGQQAAVRKWTEWWDAQRAKELRTAAPDQPPTPATARLVDTYFAAAPDRRPGLLGEYREGKGSDYSQALARVIDRLSGDERRSARDAFALRMARMTDATLVEYLNDPHPEIRRAAVHGLALRENKFSVPRIIDLLHDPQPAVVRAAYAALKHVSGQDYGPPLNATAAEVEKAAADWQNWWRKLTSSSIR